ncbi:MAG TPA: DUF2807 domain-containing protein [Chitinophagaceae bacterium]|nr:DUF2807 domain-containing protein [Chitinophagaceae bacterium]
MQPLKTILAAGMFAAASVTAFGQSEPVDHFSKVIVSPYIQVTFVQGEKESVTINDIMVDSNKLHIEVQDGTLRLYLDGAKDIPHNQHVYNGDGSKRSFPLYHNHTVVATVTYKTLDALSLRGEETHVCQSPLSAGEFTLRVYGESKVIFDEVHIGEMHTTMYGEGSLDIKAGSVDEQYYTCYGEGKINTTAIKSQESKITAFGEAEFRLNVSDRIKITAFGEAKLRYIGNPEIVKGIHLGGLDLAKID